MPSPSSDDHSVQTSRSRAGSVCSSAPSNKVKKPFGLNIFALSPSTASKPPALLSATSFSSIESHSPQTPPASPDNTSKRFSVRRQSSSSSVHAPSTFSIHSDAKTSSRAASTHSLWGDAFMDVPKVLPSHPTPNTSAGSVPFDPSSPFTYEAPVFSRRSSASSSSSQTSIILPLRSPSNSNTPSLKRQKSNLSMRSTNSVSSSPFDLGGPLRPPRMSRFGSARSSSAGSFDSLPEEAMKVHRPVIAPASVSAPAVATADLPEEGWEMLDPVAADWRLKEEMHGAQKERKPEKAARGWRRKVKKLLGAA